MALPTDITKIVTNLGMLELQKLIEALKSPCNPDIHRIGQPFVLDGMSQVDVIFDGNKYTINEEYESVTSIRRK